MRVKKHFGFLAVFLLPLVLQAQTAEDLIAKNIAAKGGAAKLEAIKTARHVLTMKVGEQEVVMRIDQQRGGKMRAEKTSPGPRFHQVFDGKAGVILDESEGDRAFRPMTQKEVAEALDEADIDEVPFINHQAKGNKVQYLGLVARRGRKLHHLRVEVKGVGIQDWYLDPATFLEAEVELQHGELQGVIGVYKAFKPVAGYLKAHRVEMMTPDGQVVGTVVNETEANVDFPEHHFVPPAKATAK